MQIIFNEQYGNLSRAQQAAYRKFNVSPSDHDMLVERFGEDSHDAITQAVKRNSEGGMFDVFAMLGA